ncbi:MAG: radical SAM protein [Planctomycetota bacterium]
MAPVTDLPSLDPRPPVASDFKVAEVMLYTTCNFNCGYCGFVTTGAVKHTDDMAPFKDRGYIDRVFQFFEQNSTPDQKWILHLSGGEPLLMPNADYFSRKFIAAGHKLALNTNLSLPIDRNGWLDDNPPWGIDALIVSLHQEALDRFERLYERLQVLREKGYRLCVRMVAHPLFMDRFEELDAKLQQIDVSFTVNPLYSPRYPKAYTAAEREKIIRHAKVNYEVLRLDGGVDATGKTCFAGSRMLCLTLGLSGGGRVYPCVNTSSPDRDMGSIFDGDVKLFTKPTPCLRQDKCCSCAIHFTHGVVPWADDTETQDAMLDGYKEGVSNTWRQWVTERGLVTKQHSSEPQGTLEGEQQLVIKKANPKVEERQLPEPAFLARARQFGLPPFTEWESIPASTATCEHRADGSIRFESTPQKYAYLLVSPKVALPYGYYAFDFKLKLELGGVTVGLADGAMSSWLVTENTYSSGRGRLLLTVPMRGQDVRLVVAACNPFGEGTVQFDLAPLEARRNAAFLAHYWSRVERVRGVWRDRWQTHAKSFFYSRHADLLQLRGRALLHGKRALGRARAGGSYQVVDSVEVGYAVRSIAPIRGRDGSLRLVTADVGDDSLSVVPIVNGRLQPRRRIQFPTQSTPMYVSAVHMPDGNDRAIVSFFNFDTTSRNHKKTYVAAIQDLDALIERGRVNDIKRELSVLFERHGHWGFRGTWVQQDDDLSYQIAAIDRNADMFYLLRGRPEATRLSGEVDRLDIGEPTEPIGVAAAPAPGDPGRMAFYMSSRKTEDLAVVGRDADGRLEVRQRYRLGGKSRSSVAVGRFLDREHQDVAVALWGGDPTDLNAAGTGSFVVARLGADGRVVGEVRQAAGVNPTDVAAGDFDGDGLDEIAVLNYGAGLGPKDRTDRGGVQIFKYVDGAFRRVGSVPLANPRIAAVLDVDGDGRDELLVSLFFERRMAVIKCL